MSDPGEGDIWGETRRVGGLAARSGTMGPYISFS